MSVSLLKFLHSLPSKCAKLLPHSSKNLQNFCMNFSTSLLKLERESCFQYKKKERCGITEYRKGLIVGCYHDHENPNDKTCKLTEAGQVYDRFVCGRLEELMYYSGPPLRPSEVRIFTHLDEEINSVALVGLGFECLGYSIAEKMDESKEAIRDAVAAGCRELQKLEMKTIFIDSCGHAESAAEGAALGVWAYQDLKAKENQLVIPDLQLYESCDYTGWQIGLQKAASQNLARQLTETPSNVMTPSTFAQNVVQILCKSGINVEVKVRGWAETLNMNAFVAASKGSCEPPIFLELSYYGTDREERPVILVGKGVTFNAGGLDLKKCHEMRLMRGDMSGAAVVAASMQAIANLELPINVRGLLPLCENMPGCSAMKPGDIVSTMNGKTVHIQHTNNAGRLMFADALSYAQTFWPRFILDVGSVSKDQAAAFGAGACATYTNSENLWKYMEAAGMHTGDRMWRMPLWTYFLRLVNDFPDFDLCNQGYDYSDVCRAAAFLYDFIPCGEWIHIDSYGPMTTSGHDRHYLRSGMTGRPTRTIIEFISQMVCARDDCNK